MLWTSLRRTAASCRAPSGQRGIALVMVIWAMALLTVLASNFTATGRTETRLAANQVEAARAQAVADAGVYRAIQGLLEADPVLAWHAREAPYGFALGGAQARLQIIDEGGKIDLNVGSDELLRGLLLQAVTDEATVNELLDAIADFRDGDNLRRLHGAEDEDYLAADLPFDAKDAPFEAVEELLQVKGMTFDRYRKIAPYLTVFSGEFQVNMNTAPRPVLAAIPGIDEAGVEALLALRGLSEDDQLDQLETAPPEIFDFLVEFGPLVYTIRSEGRTPGGGVFLREAVVRLTEDPVQPYTLIAWKQGMPTPIQESVE